MEVENLDLQHDLIQENNKLMSGYNENNVKLSGFNDLKPFLISLQEQNNQLKLRLKTCDGDKHKLLQAEKMSLIQ